MTTPSWWLRAGAARARGSSRAAGGGGVEETDLVINIGGPEASGGALVRVRGKDGGPLGFPNLVDILHDGWLVEYWFAVVDEHGHLPLHWVGGEEKPALVVEVLLDVLVGS